jgi:transcriptional regulator with XRE-family HTH domain
MARKTFEKRFPSRDSAAVKALAANVRGLRKIKEWSQDRLAAEVGVEQNVISLVENGRSNPTILLIESIALALEVRIEELLVATAPPRKTRSR